MKTFLLVIKGILMYSTLIYWVLVIALTDNFDATQTLIVFGVGFCLIFLCKDVISKEDLIKLTRITKEDLDETI